MTPNFVRVERPPGRRQDGPGIDKVPGFSLEELEPETLSDLCDEFRRELFAKAKKEDPRK